MTKLKDIVGLLQNSDRIRIIKNNKNIYVGWLANLVTTHGIKAQDGIYKQYKDDEVISIRAVNEVRHKKWKELNLIRPLEPNEAADYSFSDLEQKLYYTIYIR